jgi:hypothetical protein
MGLFFREVIRPGSNVAINVKEESMTFWDKRNKGLTELTTLCAEVGDAFVVFRPGEQMMLGVRVKNGKIAQVRSKLLKGENLPNTESLSVRGRHVYIVDGLPEAFDPREVMTYLGKKGWFVLQGNSKGCKTSQMRVLADQDPPSRIYPNSATGKNIFIYEDGKRMKEDMADKAVNEKEKGDDDGMAWEPPSLFEDAPTVISEDPRKDCIKAPTSFGSTSPQTSSSASSSAPKVVNTEYGMAEEDKKRMEVMEKDMEQLKNKLANIEGKMEKSSEEIHSKMATLELQQQAANVDIKSMFAQLISEIGAIKSTVSSAAASNPTTSEQEKERKKARVDAPNPTN